MKFASLLGVFLFITTQGWAQPPQEVWSHSYNLYLSSEFLSVAPTDHGGFIVAGRLDTVWVAPWGNPHLGQGFCLVELNASGDSVWCRSYLLHEYGYGNTVAPLKVCSLHDGGYALASSDSRGFILLKTDATGILQWHRTYGSPDDLTLNDVIEADDGGFYLVGNSAGSNAYGYIVRTSANGDSMWAREYLSANLFNSMQRRGNDTTFVLGGSAYGGNFETFWGGEIAAHGDLLWGHVMQVNDRPAPHCMSVNCTSDGGFYFTGNTFYAPDQFLIVRTNSNCDTLWTREYPGAIAYTGQSRLTSDGGLILVGGWPSTLLRLNAAGDSLWSFRHSNSIGDCIQLPSGEYLYVGARNRSSGSMYFDSYVVLLSGETSTPDHAAPIAPASPQLLPNFPNPFNALTVIRFELARASKIRLSIHDISGRFVSVLTDRVWQAGTHDVSFDAADLPSGVYFCTLQVGSFTHTKKLMLLR